MKRYIKVWLVIALVVNVLTFLMLTIDAPRVIRCNREYNKVYPCTNNYVELEIYNGQIRSKPTTATAPESDGPFVSYVDGHQIKSDAEIIFKIHLTVNIALIGIAGILYCVIAVLKDSITLRNTVSAIALVIYIIGFANVCKTLFSYITVPAGFREVHYNAPIIYLYDEQEREVTVKLDLNGELTCTYPKYDEKNGWTVKTSADGVLTDKNGRKYEYLYWEADVDMVPDFSKGFCVRGEDSAAFLEKALSDLGLSDTEANAFIMYWLPDLEENPYNVIAFQTDTYEDVAKLDVDPLPDTVVRVNMLFYGSDEYVKMEEQDLAAMNPSLEEREGFVLVEWGGGKLG